VSTSLRGSICFPSFAFGVDVGHVAKPLPAVVLLSLLAGNLDEEWEHIVRVGFGDAFYKQIPW
jgi:hypothetical protein